MINPYSMIFENSLQSAFILSFHSEYAWAAALGFGSVSVAYATIAAWAGSTCGVLLSFGLGFYLSRWREDVPTYSDERYARIASVFRRRLFWLMAIPPLFVFELMPGLSLFAAVNGMFRVPPVRAFLAIATARALYYAYHLAG